MPKTLAKGGLKFESTLNCIPFQNEEDTSMSFKCLFSKVLIGIFGSLILV